MSHRHLRRLQRAAAAIGALIGLLVLAGWGIGAPALVRGLPGLPPMPPLSAVFLIIAAASLAAEGRPARALALSVLVGGLGLAGCYLAGATGALAPLAGPLPHPAIVANIVGSGVALLLRTGASPRGLWLMQLFALLAMLNAVRALVDFIPGVNDGLLLTASEISLPGAASIVLLGVGMLASRPDGGFMALAVSDRPAGRLLRWLIAAGILGPFGAFVLIDLARRAGLFGPGFGLILLLLGNLLVFYGLAAAYDRADRGRHAAEGQLALTNADLERRIAAGAAALAAREAQISAIGDNLPGVMIFQAITDSEHELRLSYVSAGVERTSGLSVEAVRADPDLLYAQLFSADRAQIDVALNEAAQTLTPLDLELSKMTPWGLRWSRLRVQPRPLDGGQIAWDGIEVDITAQKAVEAALERDRRYQAALFACSQALLRPVETPADRTAALDKALGQLLVGAQADRAFLMHMVAAPEPYIQLQHEICAPGIAAVLMSPAPLRLPLSMVLPLIGAEVAGAPIAGTLEELAARSPAFAELVAGFGVRSLIVLPLRQSSGGWVGIGFHDCTRPRAWDDQERLLLGTAAELIAGALQRWEDEDELRRREALLTALFELLPIGVAIIDAEGLPLRMNPAISQIAGIDLEAMMAGDYEQVRYIHPDGRPVELHEHPSVRARAGELIRDMEIGVIRPDGELRWVSNSAAPLPNMGAALVIVDTTERKRVEEERLTFERKLLEAQRLESLGVLAGGVAHDFNNILATILGHAELARLDVAPTSEAAASLDAIVLGARRAADLTGQMLAYAGRGRFLTEAVDINQVARELGELTRATLPRGVTVRQHLAPEPPTVIADGTQVRQVLLNLLTNGAEAILATGEGGVVTVVTGRCELSAAQLAAATVSAGEPGRYGFLEVTDSGGGIEPATLARIFDPFFTTKFTGRGLGLAAVQGIIRSHHGALFVRSEPGRGACFRACLPLA